MKSDAQYNQGLWERYPGNPVIGTQEPWCPDFLAPCTLLTVSQRRILYAEGSSGGVEQVGAFVAPTNAPMWQWWPHEANPLLRVGEEGFDRGGVFDPSVVSVEEGYLLYYSATTGDAHELAQSLGGRDKVAYRPETESIGLAIAQDPFEFVKQGRLFQGRCPHAIVHEGMVNVFFVRVLDGGYRIHLSRSRDGISFKELPEPVLNVGPAGSWDSQTVTTPQVIRDGSAFVMLYAGDATSLDDPSGIGVAVSDDLRTWRKHPGNPVFTVGARGTFDSHSVSCPILRYVDGQYQLLYAGSDRLVAESLHSQVVLATLAVAGTKA